MNHITQTQFSEFIQERNEPEWFRQEREREFTLIHKNPMMSFQCGLAITVEPQSFEWGVIVPLASPENLTCEVKSQKEVTVLHNNDALKDEAVMQQFFSEEWKEEDDSNQIYHFNSSCMNHVLFIKIPQSTQLSEPIEINLDAGDQTTITRICILCEAQSHSKVIFYKTSSNVKHAYIADDMRVIAQPGSTCEVVVLQDIDTTSLNIQKRKAIAQKDATVNWTEVCLGTHYTRSEITSLLQGQGSSTNNTVLFLGTGEQRYDIYTGAIHNAQNTYANLLTKGVLNNNAQSLARGLISIRSNAQESNGYEQQDTLMLSDTAQANAKPDLEIHNHNVKCSHGSTIGKVDLDLRFYLMTRGLSEKQAQQKIAEGYFIPVLKEIEDEEIRERVQESIMNALEKAQ